MIDGLSTTEGNPYQQYEFVPVGSPPMYRDNDCASLIEFKRTWYEHGKCIS